MPAAKSGILKIRNARISFPKLWNPEAYDKNDKDANKKYSANFIIDGKTILTEKVKGKWETVSVERYLEIADKLCQEFFKKPHTRKSFKLPFYFLKDGDTLSAEGNDRKPEYEGCEILKAEAWESKQPAVVSETGIQLAEESQDKIYAGCRVHCTIHLEPWKNETYKNKGVRAVLRGTQFAGDDEPFGAAPCDVDDEFDDESDSYDADENAEL